MKTNDGYIQGYYAQAAVDGTAQIIVAQTLTNSSSDQGQLVPLLNGIRAKWDQGQSREEPRRSVSRRRLLFGCQSSHDQEAAHRWLRRHRKTEAWHHVGHRKKTSTPGSLVAKMSTKLRRTGYRSRYRLRKQIVEPVFGQIKQARGFHQFLLRCIEKVRAKWVLICTAHNLVKLGRAA